MHHENILKVFGLCIDGQEMNIVSELCYTDLDCALHGGNRGGRWREKVSFSVEQRISIMIQICRGMQYLHNEKRLIHGDLKPANVLLNKEMKVAKIGDLGFAKVCL